MSNTALLVIDIQRAAFDGAFCPPIDGPETLVDQATTLLDAARAGGHTVVFVKHCEGAGEPFEKGTVHWELHPSLVPATNEMVVEKFKSSAFENTELDALLKSRGVESLVVCGLQSEFCVSNTTRSALQLGYAVQVAQDGHSTWPSDGRTAADIVDDANKSLAEAGASLKMAADLASTLSRPAA